MEKITIGTRNDTFNKWGKSLKGKSFTFKETLASLLASNKVRCNPPLPDSEVESIVTAIYKEDKNANITD